MSKPIAAGSNAGLCLNVASSHYVLPGFVNLDNHVLLGASKWPPFIRNLLFPRHRVVLDDYRKAHAEAVLVRHDCRKPLPFGDDSVDHILCSHFLEHVHPDEAEAILRDFRRALRPGGTVHIVVPDLDVHVADYLRRRGGPDAGDGFMLDTMLGTKGRGSLRYRLLEALGGFGLQHRWMYDRASIGARIEAAGFRIADLGTPSSLFRLGDGAVHIVAVND